MSNEVRGREQFQKFKPIINILVNFCSVLPEKTRMWLFQHFRMTTGKKGLVIRYVLLKTLAKSCGDNVSIHPSVFLFKLNNLSIGNNVSIHPMCYIDATGEIEIRDDVSIAHGVTILSTTHTFSETLVPIKNQKTQIKKTTIQSNVWIGAKVTILYGNRIGEGSIIGANSVVTKNIESNTICAGIPAKVIKKR